MRAVTVFLWVLAGFLLVVAVRSYDRAGAMRVARVEPEVVRAEPLAPEPREAGRVGPCWDGVARELLHVGSDRWLGVGCDVEGAPRRGESPECALVRKKVTRCLHRDRRLWVPPPPSPYPAPDSAGNPFDGCDPWGGPPKPVEGARPIPTS